MKKCTKCKQVMNSECFHKDASAKSGLNAWCISCKAIHQREHKEERSAYVKKWQRDNPDKVKKANQKFKRTHDSVEYREKMNAYQRQYMKKYIPLNREKRREYQLTDLQKNPERTVFSGMKARCNNPKHRDYKNYGGRGIKVLYKNYAEFINDVGKRPSERLREFFIDREDNDGHYEPGNCRWVTPKESANNRHRGR